jgi:hypothetical protein
MNIEDTILTGSLPCNSLAMMARLTELLDGGNCLQDVKTDPRVRAVMWLLNYQVYGQLANIDMMAEYRKLSEALTAVAVQ